LLLIVYETVELVAAVAAGVELAVDVLAVLVLLVDVLAFGVTVTSLIPVVAPISFPSLPHIKTSIV
jgi:hypothetical protein